MCAVSTHTRYAELLRIDELLHAEGADANGGAGMAVVAALDPDVQAIMESLAGMW
jgi:hypothetical protein